MIPTINKETIENIVNKHFDTLEDKIDNISKRTFNVQDIIYKQSPLILKRGLEFNSKYQKEFTEYDLRRVPLSKIIQSQYDDYYKNASSEFTAEQFQKVLDGELTSDDIREQDFYPLLIDKETNIIIDGNHRHYALSKVNSPYAVVLYGESGEQEKLTGEDIFDITTTGMPYYDGMINPKAKNAVEYFKNNKGLTFKIVYMNPEEYLIKAFKMHRDFIDDLDFDTYIDVNVNFERVEEYKQRTLSGSKMPIPVLDYNSNSQEGRHRSMVAQQLDVDEIPVLVVKSYEE